VIQQRTPGARLESILEDGSVVHLRPLRTSETEPIARVFAGMSELSRARRFLTGMPYLPDRVLQALAEVGTRDHVAWLATIDEDAVGIGRYAAADHRSVDIALEVVDPWHHRGIGGLLLDAVATSACVHGFTGVTATVDPANHASVRLMRRVGLTLQVSDGLLEGTGQLRLPDPPLLDRRALLEVLANAMPGAAADVSGP
jgi:L-amino acid N-acyltransferase YncA